MIILSKPTVEVSTSSISYSTGCYSKLKYFEQGREAGPALLRELGIHSGSVAIAAYMCRSFVDCFVENGFKVCLYDIQDLCNLNVVALDAHLKLHKPKALILCHYFGLMINNRLEVIDLAKKNNVYLIEDYCHSYESFCEAVSKDEEISYALFSFRKTLPVKKGAAYFKFDSTLNKSAQKIQFNSKSKNTTIRLINRIGWPNIYSDKIDLARRMLSALKIFKSGKGSGITEEKLPDNNLLAHLSHNYVQYSSEKRVNNFYLLAKLIDFENTFFKVERNICVPQIFVIYDKTGDLASYLRMSGIGAYKWPGKDIDPKVRDDKRFINLNKLLNEVTCIPIHQDILEKEIHTIGDKIKKFYSEINE